MKKILIAGSESYIGTSFENYIKSNFSDDYIIDTVDMKDTNWVDNDFSSYDSIFYVAGIAHSDNSKITPEKSKLYYSVNTDLTIKAAEKAKKDGAKQFIFMSSAIVYGNSAPIDKSKVINIDTPETPDNCYGDSKLQAENGIAKLEDENFNIVILRPPMIYGKNSKGNYPILSKFAQKLPFFPYVNNQRSMLYIENLCEFVRLMVDNNERGVFFPQNKEYTNTSNMVKLIANVHKKNIYILKGFAWLLKIVSKITPLVNKAFGSMCYEKSISEYKVEYRKFSLEESIVRTEE